MTNRKTRRAEAAADRRRSRSRSHSHNGSGEREGNVRLDGTPYRFAFKTIGCIDPPPPPTPLRLKNLRAVLHPKEVYGLLAKDAPGDPLWRQFARMTSEQAREEQRAEYELSLIGRITDEEIDTRMAAWRRAAGARGVPFVDHIQRQHDLDRYLLTPEGWIIDHTPDEGIEEDAVLDEADPECVRLRAAFGRPMPSVVPMVTLLNGAIVNRRLEWIWSASRRGRKGRPRSRTGRSAPSGASGSTTG